MAAPASSDGLRGFLAYYRVYARSGIHAASAAALTALGLLASTVDQRLVVLAIAVYVLPPIYLYLVRDGHGRPSETGRDDDTEDGARRSKPRENDEDSDSTVTETDSGDAATAGDIEGWADVDTPTDETLRDVVASGTTAYAVGDGGVVLARRPEGWALVLERGPTASSNPLRGVDVTDDGSTAWFAGDSGVLARYDEDDGRHTDHSAPNGETSTWEDVAVSGASGAERLYLVNGSGEILRGEFDGETVDWDESTKPGSGSSMTAIEFDGAVGYACDSNARVYETTDGGEAYDPIGIEDGNTAFADITATGSDVAVAGEDGSVFRYDGATWTRLHVGEGTLSAIDRVDERGLVASETGVVYELTDGDWELTETPIDDALFGVALGGGRLPDVAVGTDGRIIERRR